MVDRDLRDKGFIRDQIGERGLVGTSSGQSGNVNLIVLPPFREEVTIFFSGIPFQESDIGTAFILGHADNGKLGTSALGAGTKSDFSTVKIVNPNNVFFDPIVDTFYRDDNVDTSTWDTANSQIDFSKGDIMQTKEFFLDGRDAFDVRPQLTYSGTLRVMVCGNGDASFPNFFEVDNNDSDGVTPISSTVRFKLDTDNYPGGYSFVLTQD